MNTGFNVLLSQVRKAAFGECVEGCCVKCKKPFTEANVFTTAGWRETTLSGMCEACWDNLFKEDE
jgi:hypothetical protein